MRGDKIYVIFGKDLEYISDEGFSKLFNQSIEISRLLSGLITSLKD